MSALLELNKLSVHYRSEETVVKAVSNVDLYVQAGESVGLVGESGCGKSSLALAMLRLIDPPGRIFGSISWEGIDLLNLTEREMRRVRGSEIAMVFQDPFTALDPVFTVGEQIAEVLRFHKGLSRQQSWKRAVELLDMVHIIDPAKRAADHPHQWSGGMRQRAAIAMACALSPKLLIADEPTTALDVTTQKSILELLKEIRTSMIFISHNLALVASVCSRAYVMENGQMVESAAPIDLIRSPKHEYTKKLADSFKEINDAPYNDK